MPSGLSLPKLRLPLPGETTESGADCRKVVRCTMQLDAWKGRETNKRAVDRRRGVRVDAGGGKVFADAVPGGRCSMKADLATAKSTSVLSPFIAPQGTPTSSLLPSLQSQRCPGRPSCPTSERTRSVLCVHDTAPQPVVADSPSRRGVRSLQNSCDGAVRPGATLGGERGEREDGPPSCGFALSLLHFACGGSPPRSPSTAVE